MNAHHKVKEASVKGSTLCDSHSTAFWKRQTTQAEKDRSVVVGLGKGGVHRQSMQGF